MYKIISILESAAGSFLINQEISFLMRSGSPSCLKNIDLNVWELAENVFEYHIYRCLLLKMTHGVVTV